MGHFEWPIFVRIFMLKNIRMVADEHFHAYIYKKSLYHDKKSLQFKAYRYIIIAYFNM